MSNLNCSDKSILDNISKKNVEEKTNKNIDRVLNLQKEISNYFHEHKYKIITDIKTITNKTTIINYTCICNEDKKKMFKDILKLNCKNCNNLKSKKTPDENNLNHPTDDLDEKWAPVEGGFISSKGRACNINGKILISDEKGRYYIAGKSQYISILMAIAFKIDGYDKLKGQKSNLIVRVKDKNNITLENIFIGTRNEVGLENGKKSRQSEEFKNSLDIDLIEHIKKYNFITLNDFPMYKIFEDGNIFNKERGQGCNRFLTASISKAKDEKSYKSINTNKGSFKVHRLICYAFHPIEGFTSLEDYKNYDVNHKDGNTLNNHKDNLEWVSKSENMIHAYETKLNKKVRPVLKFILNEDGSKGEFIAEYESVAKAARECQISEHQIREPARNKRPQKNFYWCYKFEEENDAWSKKFSSK